jgi:hypothetical protein
MMAASSRLFGIRIARRKLRSPEFDSGLPLTLLQVLLVVSRLFAVLRSALLFIFDAPLVLRATFLIAFVHLVLIGAHSGPLLWLLRFDKPTASVG